MLDKKITRHADTFFLDYCRGRKRQLQKKLQVTIDDFAARNMLHSSFPIKEISEIYAEELKVRSEFAWESMRRVLEAHRIEPTDNLAKDLEAKITYHISKSMERLFSEIRDTWTRIGISNTGPLRDYANRAEVSIASARAQAVTKNRAEINLYVDALRKKALSQEIQPMVATRNTSRVDHYINKLKNHPFLAAVIVIAVVVIGISHFMGAIDSILSLFSPSKHAQEQQELSNIFVQRGTQIITHLGEYEVFYAKKYKSPPNLTLGGDVDNPERIVVLEQRLDGFKFEVKGAVTSGIQIIWEAKGQLSEK